MMETPEIRVARLDNDRLAKVKALESELGTVVVAYQPSYEPAQLNEAQLAKLRAVEEELDLILVAFDSK